MHTGMCVQRDVTGGTRVSAGMGIGMWVWAAQGLGHSLTGWVVKETELGPWQHVGSSISGLCLQEPRQASVYTPSTQNNFVLSSLLKTRAQCAHWCLCFWRVLKYGEDIPHHYLPPQFNKAERQPGEKMLGASEGTELG